MPDTDWISTADATWYKRVLHVLQRDFPGVADAAWSRAITENAAEIEARRVPLVCTACRKPVDSVRENLLGEIPDWEPGADEWQHAADEDAIACPASGSVIKAMVAAGNESVPRDA